MTHRRIACRRARRVRYGPSPDRVPSGPSPDRVRYGPSPDRVSSRLCPPQRPHVSAIMVRRAERPSSAMPRPNSACNRRRLRRSTNMFSFTPPWRSLGARSAARLRRTVGRHLNPKSPCRTRPRGVQIVVVGIAARESLHAITLMSNSRREEYMYVYTSAKYENRV